MNDREIVIKKELTGRKENEFLKVSIAYETGGMSMSTYKEERRGYYLHVSIREEKHENGFTMVTYPLFNSGLKHFLEEAKRFNAKRLGEITVDPAIVESIKVQVLEMTKSKQGA
jgi:hypothetical protein